MFISIESKEQHGHTLYTLIDSDFQAQYIADSNCRGANLLKVDIENIIYFYSARDLNVSKNIYLYLMWLIGNNNYYNINDILSFFKEEDKNQIMSYISKYTNLN